MPVPELGSVIARVSFLRENGETPANPTWRLAAPVTAPAAGTALITVAAVANRKHRVYGWIFGKEDVAGNLIQLREGAAVRTGFSAPDSGAMRISCTPILVAAINTAISLNNLNAGAAGIDYVGALLVETAP